MTERYSKEWWAEWRKNPDNYKKHIIKTAKWRAKKKGIEFDIDVDSVEWVDECPVFGKKLVYRSSKETEYDWWFKASIDRIDPGRGYTKGNVRIVSFLANYMCGNKHRISQGDGRRIPTYARTKPELMVAFDMWLERNE